MGQKTIKGRIKLKRDTASNWEKNNPVLLNGEKIIVDTNSGEVRSKIGDGIKKYTELPFDDETIKDSIAKKADKTALETHTGNSAIHVTSTDKTNLNTAYTHSQAAHAPSNAQANQNAFSKILVGTTNVEADSPTDTLTLSGSNVTLTPDATNDKVTIGITKENVTTALGYTPPTTDTKYTHPAYTSKTSGLYKVTVDSTGHVSEATAVTKSDITALGIPAANTDTHYASKNVVGSNTATSNTTTALTNGNVYLNSVENGAVTSAHKISGSGATTVTADASGNIIISSTDTNTTYGNATSSNAGLMSSTDKSKLDGIASGANNYTLPTASSTLGGVKTTSTVTSNTGYTACPIIGGVPYYKDTNNEYTLSSFGVNASAAELNYVKGVTSSIQTQLNSKAATSHSHTKSQISDFPDSLKNPYSLTLQFNGTTNKTYDGSSAQTLNITPSAIGAAASSHTHNYAGASSAGGSANSAAAVYGTLTNPSTVSTYYVPFHSGASTGNKNLLNNNGLAYYTQEGTAYVTGLAQLTVGNNTSSGKAGNKQGKIAFYGSSSGSTTLVPENNTTSDITINLPAASGTIALTDHVHNYAGSSSSNGSANSAVKLDSSAGSATNPVYFSGGKPVACTYTLGKSVPSNAVFTDTTYSTATTSSSGLMSASDKTKLNSIDTSKILYFSEVSSWSE